MNSQLSDFIRKAVVAAITPVEKFQARCTKLFVSTVDGAPQICVVIDYVAGRHGCGSEQDGFWAHSNDRDSGASSFTQDYRLSEVNHSGSLLVPQVVGKLEEIISASEAISIRLEFHPYEGYAKLPTLIGSFSQEDREADLSNS